MTSIDATRSLMAHNALDSGEVQSLKRLWWSLYNTLRLYDFLEVTLAPAMQDVEILVTSLIGA